MLEYSTFQVPTRTLNGIQFQSFKNFHPNPEPPTFGYNENSNNIAVTGVYKNTFFGERNSGNLSAQSLGKGEQYPGHYKTSSEPLED
jgi:hypothetical protein